MPDFKNTNARLGLRHAFTLAEVLIVLGIIGLIADMTIPTLMSQYQRKVLEVQFKKTYSSLAQAVEMMKIDAPIYVGNVSEGSIVSEFYDKLYSLLRVTNKSNKSIYAQNNIKVTNYVKKGYSEPQCSQPKSTINRYLADGTAIGGMKNCGVSYISIDLNGKRPPNALGHDIFIFAVNSNGKLIMPEGDAELLGHDEHGNAIYDWNSTTCTKNSQVGTNGALCSKFAVANICPDDDKKTYWECLP